MSQNTAPSSADAGTWLERLCRDLGIPEDQQSEDEIARALAAPLAERNLGFRDVLDVALVLGSAVRRLRSGALRNVVQVEGFENLTPRMQSMLLRLQGASVAMGLPDPLERIISAFRSPERQRELQAAWDRGQREGLRVRPADSSPHSKGEAVDLRGTEEELEAWGEAWEKLGGRWGGRFFPRRDTPHIDLGA